MQTEELFLVLDYSRAQYCKTATEAVLACGFNKWDCALPALAVSRLMPGDEMSMNAYYSIVRLSGKDIDYVDLRN